MQGHTPASQANISSKLSMMATVFFFFLAGGIFNCDFTRRLRNPDNQDEAPDKRRALHLIIYPSRLAMEPDGPGNLRTHHTVPRSSTIGSLAALDAEILQSSPIPCRE